MKNLLLMVAAAVAIAVGIKTIRKQAAPGAVATQPPGLNFPTVPGGDFGESAVGAEFMLFPSFSAVTIPGGDFGEGAGGAEAEFNLTPAQVSAAQKEAFDSLII